MKVENYAVKWQYIPRSITRNKKKGIVTDTICLIKDNNIKADDNIIAISKTTCSIKDEFNRETGRKISLQRALNKKDLGGRTIFDKQKRTQFWQAFRTLTFIPKW